MKVIDVLKSYLLYSGTDQDKYEIVKEDMHEMNLKSLRLFTTVLVIAFAALTAVSFSVDFMVINRILYVSCFIVAAIIWILCFTIAHNSMSLTGALVAAFLILCYAYGIVLGAIVPSEQLTVSYVVILFALPLLFTVRPVYLVLGSLASMIIYFAIGYYTEPAYLLSYNASNIIPFGLISMVVSTYLMSIKMERIVLMREKQQLSETDQLTGALNRRSYDNHLDQIRSNEADIKLKVCAMDLNGLKQVNDNLGHEAGDELIIGGYQCICSVMDRYGQIYRTGGDEFIAILEGESPDPDELIKALNIKCARWQGEMVKSLSISCGIAQMPPGRSVDEVIRLADKIMYQNKAEHYRQKEFDRRSRR